MRARGGRAAPAVMAHAVGFKSCRTRPSRRLPSRTRHARLQAPAMQPRASRLHGEREGPRGRSAVAGAPARGPRERRACSAVGISNPLATRADAPRRRGRARAGSRPARGSRCLVRPRLRTRSPPTRLPCCAARAGTTGRESGPAFRHPPRSLRLACAPVRSPLRFRCSRACHASRSARTLVRCVPVCYAEEGGGSNELSPNSRPLALRVRRRCRRPRVGCVAGGQSSSSALHHAPGRGPGGGAGPRGSAGPAAASRFGDSFSRLEAHLALVCASVCRAGRRDRECGAHADRVHQRGARERLRHPPGRGGDQGRRRASGYARANSSPTGPLPFLPPLQPPLPANPSVSVTA